MSKNVKRKQAITLLGVLVLSVLMPGLLRLAKGAFRTLVGAEGRLAAIGIDTGRVLGPMPRVWAGLAQGGTSLPAFWEENSDSIKSLKPDYIRIDHIYDGYGVVRKIDGSPVYDWSSLDKIVSGIMQTGAKPFLSLSYMPAELGGGNLLGEPTNWNEWSNLVKATIEHYSGALAIDGVYYEVWNEPDLFGSWKMGGGKDYRSLYYYSARGAKAVVNVKEFKIGGPATTGLYRSWMDNFFPFILRNQLRLDFFSWHRYDLNLNQYNSDAASVDRWLEGQPYFSQTEQIISEFGPSSDAGGVNDNTAGAAHLVSVVRELIGKIKYAFSFEIGGNWGIIGKPRYQALLWLAGLGPERLSVTGEGTWIRAIAAKKGKDIQVIIANYDPRGIHSEAVPVSFLGLSGRNYTLKTKLMGKYQTEQQIATSEAILQTKVLMPPNSVAWVELSPQY